MHVEIPDASPMCVTELLRREGHAEEEPLLPCGRPLRMYRVVAVLAGFVLLCAAATGATTALSGPRAERTVPGAGTVQAISGAEALRPDLISGPDPAARPSLEEDSGDGRGEGGASVPNEDDRNPPNAESTPRSLPPASPAGDAPQQRSTTASRPPAEGPPPDRGSLDDRDANSNPVLNTVTKFYQTVIAQPHEAFDLLSPSLQGSGYPEFQRAWAGVQRATVEDIHQEDPHAALVTVRLEQRDGGVLRTLQHVVVIPGGEPRIVEVVLLSASRS